MRIKKYFLAALALTTLISAAGAAQRQFPPENRTQWTSLPRGTKFEFDLGEINAAYSVKHVVPSADAVAKVRWDASSIRNAGAVVLQVSRGPFGRDGNPILTERTVYVSREAGKAGAANIQVGKLASEQGYSPDPGGLSRSRPSQASQFMGRNGQLVLFARVIPVRAVADLTPVGLASEPLQIVYAKPPANPIVIEKWFPPASGPPPFQLVGLTYKPASYYCFVHPNLNVCEDAGKSPTWYERIIAFASDLWNWMVDSYANIKNKVIDIAANAFPVVPRDVFVYALDAALASCGLPPNLPNLDELMEQGADYLAGEIVAQVGPPVAGDLAKEKLKGAILQGANAAKKKVGSSGPSVPCSYTVDFPVVIAKIKYTGTKPIAYARIALSDVKNGTFSTDSVTLSKWQPGATLPLAFPLKPNMFAPKYVVGGVVKETLWWNDYNHVPTQLVFSAADKPLHMGLTFGTTGERYFYKPFKLP